MARRARSYCFRAGSALALALLIAGCTKGGQFDPTEIFNSDMFDSKKKLKGERVPVFPEGVPGATTGVPADLVQGYQAPPEQPDPDVAVPGPTPPAAAAEAAKPKPKPNPKPKPKLAAQKPPASPDAAAAAAPPTRITVGPASKPATQQPDTSVWPAPPSTRAPQSQTSQSVWPAPPQTTSSSSAPPSQSIWPDPPPPAGSSR